MLANSKVPVQLAFLKSHVGTKAPPLMVPPPVIFAAVPSALAFPRTTVAPVSMVMPPVKSAKDAVMA